MNKAKYLIVAAGMLDALALAGCNPDYTEDLLPLPPNLPHALLEDEKSGDVKNYRFTLTWKRITGKLSSWEEYLEVYDEEIAEAITEVYETWLLYEKKINPLPHYAPADEDEELDFAVYDETSLPWMLDNSDATKKIVINRCWPQSLIKEINAGTKQPTRDAWLGSTAERVEEFKQAVKGIKGMMAAIEKSPLYEFEVDGEPLLKSLHERMAEFIAFPSDPEDYPDYANRPLWVDLEREAMKQGQYYNNDPNLGPQTGPLYEFFFGYVPAPGDYTRPHGIVFPGVSPD
jgi:hypothetical protein